MNEALLVDTSRQLVDTQTAVNILWVILAGTLVMFMQAGFALLETGLTRAKNAAHTMAMNFLVYAIAILGFWSIGFGLQMGGVGAIPALGGDASLSSEFVIRLGGKEFGLFGTTGFCLPPAILTPAIAALFFFQTMFMATAATIPTGALAERWRFKAFILMSLATSTLIYPLYANWVWGGGFLSTLGRNFGLGHGHVDFAGSSVVHMTGGLTALVCAKLLGPRHGKYRGNGRVNALPGHNIPMVVLGTFVLAFGWFGFNAGSTLSAVDTRLAVVALNTMLASAAGACAGAGYSWHRFGKPDLTMMCNGMLAGLVAITASCAFVSSASAVLIGAIAGVLVIEATLFVETKLRIDDPVGAVSVHCVNGMWGILALGLFADGSYGDGLNGVPGQVTGLFYGDASQLAASLIGIVTNLVFVGGMAAMIYKGIDKLVGHRVAITDEIQGLDVSEMGIEGYYTADPASGRASIPPALPSRPPAPVTRPVTNPRATPRPTKAWGSFDRGA
jgi:ammonium transporter, Amt family